MVIFLIYLLLEVVEQISTVFNLSLEGEVVPLEWKEANINIYFKKFEKQVRELLTSEFNIGDLQTIRKTN